MPRRAHAAGHNNESERRLLYTELGERPRAGNSLFDAADTFVQLTLEDNEQLALSQLYLSTFSASDPPLERAVLRFVPICAAARIGGANRTRAQHTERADKSIMNIREGELSNEDHYLHRQLMPHKRLTPSGRAASSPCKRKGLMDRIELAGTFCIGQCQSGVNVMIDGQRFSVTPETTASFFNNEVLSRLGA